MKKCFLLLALSTFILQTAHSQTNVSGGIYANTTWTLANSPYIVTDTVVVFPGVTLTIEPGVVVKFDSSNQLEIRQAQLIAMGTITDSITFTSNSLTPVAGSYSGIYLNGGNITPRFNYCNFRYAGIGIHVNVSDTVIVNNSSFDQNLVGLQFIGSGSNSQVAVIYNSNFNYNNTGMDLETIGSSQINYCNFTYNTNDGLILIDNNSSFFPRMDYCNFSFNGNGLFWHFLSSMIHHCHFSNNTNGMQATMIFHNYYTYNNTIRDCIFDYNQMGGWLVYFLVDSCTAVHNQTGIEAGACTIQNCIIDSNSVFGISAGYDSIGNCKVRYNGIGINTILASTGISTIDGNLIEHNTGANITCPTGSFGIIVRGNTIRYGSTGIDNVAGNFTITSNIIEDNDTGINLYSSGGTISCNMICSNTNYDLFYGATGNIDVSHNYWCTADSASTEAVIYDGYDNVNYGLVSFLPFDSICSFATFVNEITNNNSISLFPNPTSSETTLHSSTSFTNASLTVYNIYGQQVKQLNHLTGQTVTLHRDHLVSGLYFLRLTENNKTLAVEKLVIEDN